MYEDPRRDVEPHLTSQIIGIARDGYRWGEEDTFRISHHAAEQETRSVLMRIAFSCVMTPPSWSRPSTGRCAHCRSGPTARSRP